MKKILIFLTFTLLSLALPSLGIAQQEKTESVETKEEIYIPKDLEDCFKELNKLLKSEDIAKIRSGEIEPIQMHLGLGMGLRNSWGLWGGSRLARHFNELGIHHPDDMSGIILDSYARHLKGEPIELDEQVRYYQEHWAKMKEAEESRKVEQDASPNTDKPLE